jgi:hypothetical protein
VNGIGNGSVALANVAITGGTISGNTTASNVTVSSGTFTNVTLSNVTISSVSTPITAAEGGTGSSSAFTANGVVYASSTSALATGSALTWNGTAFGVATNTPNVVNFNNALSINTTTNGTSALELNVNNVAQALFFSNTSTAIIGSYSNIPFAFRVNNSEVARFNTSGYLGIGTSSPYVPLQVAGTIKTAPTNQSGVIAFGGNTNSSTQLGIFRGDANSTADGNWLNIAGYTGITFSASAANIGSQTEAMRIDNSGNLLVGTTSNTYSSRLSVKSNGDNTAAEFYRLGATAASGIVAFNSNSGGTETLKSYIDTSSGLLVTTSDERLKNVTGTYTNALVDILNIQAVKYTWKSDTENTPQVGVLAQSVHSVVPEAVNKHKINKTDDTEYLNVSYSSLIPILIASVQELSAKVTALEAKLGV